MRPSATPTYRREFVGSAEIGSRFSEGADILEVIETWQRNGVPHVTAVFTGYELGDPDFVTAVPVKRRRKTKTIDVNGGVL